MPNFHGAHSSQLAAALFQRRCDLYSQAAASIADLEDALASEPAQVRTHLRALRRALRSGLAFLDRSVVQELERLESLCPAAGRVPDLEARAELGERTQMLHLQLARLLRRSDAMHDLTEICSLDPRVEQRLRDEAKVEEAQARAQALEEECQGLEAEARRQLASEDYGKAARALRRAIKIDPRRAVLRNDLGVVLSLQGKTEEAIAEYRAAIALNDQEPGRRTEEWTTSYYNLGVALRKVAQVAFRSGRPELGREHLESAGDAFNAFSELQRAGHGAAGKARLPEAEAALAEIRRRLGVVV